MSSKLRRQVFYTAVSKHFKGADVYEVTLLLLSQVSDVSSSDLGRQVKAACKSMDAIHRYSGLLHDIRESLQLPEYLLLDDPLELLQQYAANKSGIADAPGRSFAVLLVNIGRSLDLIAYPDLPKQIEAALNKKGLSSSAANAIQLSLSDGKPRLISEEILGDYADVLNTAYVVLCETLGPVKADEILSRSVELVEKSKYGKAFSAKNFL